MSIKFKFAIFISFITLLMVGGTTWFLYYAEKNLISEQLKNYQQSIITGFAQIVKESTLTGDELILINYVNLVKKTDPCVESAFVVDLKGVIVAHSDPKLMKKKFIKRDSSAQSELIDLSSPVFLGTQKTAVCTVSFFEKELKKKLEIELDKAKDKIVSVAVFALIAGFMGAWLFSYFITAPIKLLSEGAEIIGSGNLNHKINVKRNDELGQLAEHFNSMSLKLKELDEMKKDFMSSVTHELRSPLSAIETYVNLLLSKNPEYERENFLRIQKNIIRLRNFINDLLDSAKIEKGKMEITKLPFDIAAAIRDIVELYKPQAADKKLTLDFLPETDTIEIDGDEDKIRQVVTNLISNSLKFTPENGRITVKIGFCETKEIKDNAMVSLKCVKTAVSDNGIGIPQDAMSRIFEKFEQVKHVREQIKGPKGTGLGLAIAKGIVELHGGKIWAESELNKGTTFYFVLPI